MIQYHELPTDIRHKYFDYYAAIVSAYPSYTFIPLTETTFNDDYAPAVPYPSHGLAYYESTGFVHQWPIPTPNYISKGPKARQAHVYGATDKINACSGCSSYPVFSKTSSASCFYKQSGQAIPFIPRSWYTTPAQRALQSLRRP